MSIVLQAGADPDVDRVWGVASSRDAAAARVAAAMVPGATVLPLTTFVEASVYPVVVWDRKALTSRLAGLVAPAVTTDRVRTLLEDQVPSVLRMAAMIGVGAPTRTRRSLRPLRSLSRTIALFPVFPRRSPLIAEECDAQGSALVVCDGGPVQVHVGGDAGVRAGSALSPLWRRVYEERLFAWAIRSDALPFDSAPVEGFHPRPE